MIVESEELKAVISQKGWKRIERWIERQDEGGQRHLESEQTVLNAWSLIKFFNMFLRYLMFTHEKRAYNKLKTYIQVTIQKGDDYARRRAKEQERKKG